MTAAKAQLNLDKELVERARRLGVDVEAAAEAGLAEAVRKAALESQWCAENAAAIESYNARIRSDGPALVPSWAAALWNDPDR